MVGRGIHTLNRATSAARKFHNFFGPPNLPIVFIMETGEQCYVTVAYYSDYGDFAMANGGTIHILNHFPFPITVYVAAGHTWNCCDEPLPGPVGYLQTNGSTPVNYIRTDGHDCENEQGRFQLQINTDILVGLNFDREGQMAPPDPKGCQAALSRNGSSEFTLIVYQ